MMHGAATTPATVLDHVRALLRTTHDAHRTNTTSMARAILPIWMLPSVPPCSRTWLWSRIDAQPCPSCTGRSLA